jgi:putative nucleotidyltransferase with HDIG domain
MLFLDRAPGGAAPALPDTEKHLQPTRVLSLLTKRLFSRIGVAIFPLSRLFGGKSKARKQLVENHLESVKAIALAMEARDSYTQGHCLRVRFMSRRILERLGVDPEYREAAEAAALLHDVGKIGIPDAILFKKGKLTKDEYARVMLHVDIGVEILRPLTTLKDTVLFVKHHHEHFDGSGYPDGLKGEAIPLASRVIAVADTIDAMRSSRPYRKALSLEETLDELRKASGQHLDPRIVDIAVSLIAPQFAGRWKGELEEEAPQTVAELEQV